MKFLELDSLDAINSKFQWEQPECVVTGRIEAYSCKSAGTDKKLHRSIENKYNGDSLTGSGSFSPDELSTVSPFGKLNQATSRKTFFYLLATLNEAFPDYDFEDARPDQFLKVPQWEIVMNYVNSAISNSGNPTFVNNYRPWDVLNEIVELNDCDVYSYEADADDNPMNEGEGYLWSMNYFFFNRKLKRMVFFSIINESHPIKEEEEADEDNPRLYQDDFSMDDME